MKRKEVMEQRCSRRSYQKQPLSQEDIAFIQERIDKLNTAYGLKLCLEVEKPEVFAGLKKSYGLFHNVQNYILLIGIEQDVYSKEKIGYAGEMLVLDLCERGLGTCWVGGSYDHELAAANLKEQETLYGVITVGYVKERRSVKENMISKITKRKGKSIAELCGEETHLPQWMQEGLRAVQLAPSALAAQPVVFHREGNKVYARVAKPDTLQMIDLGIAMAHFALGAEEGTWTWGNPAVFQYTK